MIKFKNILLVGALFATTMACEEEFDSEGIAVGTIRFPAIEIVGDPLILLENGEAYQDAGATATLGTDDVTSDIETTNNVDVNTGGLYTVDYAVEKVNELGDEVSVLQQRVVLVVPKNPGVEDLSGNYVRPSNGVTLTWTKVAPGIYQVSNIGGVAPPGSVIPVYVFHLADGTIFIPTQPVSNGTLSGEINLTANGYQVVLDNPAFLNNLRTFQKS